MNKVELLAPAGSREALIAAVGNGADGVYLGGRDFSARSFAANFSDDELFWAIDYCHSRGVSIYITVNTVYKDAELNRVFDFMDKMYRHGADAFILQDLGLAKKAKKLFPDIQLHASTQQNAHSVSHVKALAEWGFSRAILARELSLNEIREINQSVPDMFLEAFCHGALCVCYSGQCYMSGYLGGRSGNRGKCAQPCRLEYQLLDQSGQSKMSGFLLSTRDLMTLDRLKEITDAGVKSLKIEGRMKGPEYIAAVTRAYRAAIDALSGGPSPEEYIEKAAKDIFNRGGLFTDGYYFNHSGEQMMSTKTPDMRTSGPDKKLVDELSLAAKKEKKRPVSAVFTAHVGEVPKLRLEGFGYQVSVSGEQATEISKSAPLTKERLESQLKKSGDAAFYIETLEINADSDIFLPVSMVNAIRRDGLGLFEKRIIESFRREADQLPEISCGCPGQPTGKTLTVLCHNINQLKAALTEEGPISVVYLELPQSQADLAKAKVICDKRGVPLFGALPVVNRGQMPLPEMDGYLVRNPGDLMDLRQRNKTVSVDYNIPVTNHLSNEAFEDCHSVNLSQLSFREMAGFGRHYNEITIYGKPLFMTTVQCPIGRANKKGTGLYCKDKSNVSPHFLKDRTGAKLPVIPECEGCFARIYNDRPIYLLNRPGEVLSCPAGFLRLEFVDEEPETVREIMKAAVLVLKNIGTEPEFPFTYGNFFKGIL